MAPSAAVTHHRGCYLCLLCAGLSAYVLDFPVGRFGQIQAKDFDCETLVFASGSVLGKIARHKNYAAASILNSYTAPIYVFLWEPSAPVIFLAEQPCNR